MSHTKPRRALEPSKPPAAAPRARGGSGTTHSPKRDRILVAYSSRLGSTAEIAACIGRVLSEAGAAVDVKAIDQVDGLEGYSRVVVGSAIRYDRWLSDAREFVTAHRQALSDVPVALFFTCLAMAKPEGAAKAASYAKGLCKLLPGANEAEVGRFAGVLSFSKAPRLTRMALRVISWVTGVEEGDHRDWDAIRAWSEGLFRGPVPKAPPN